MTAASAERALARASRPPPSINWSMAGVLVTVAGAAIGAISAYATLTDRVAHLEAQIPPGAIQRLDERTVQIQEALRRLESRDH